MAQRTALIAGGLGVIGRALVEHLEDDGDWQAIALSRRAPDFETRARFISVDLEDRAACAARLGELDAVTHVFFTSYAPRASFAEEVAPNMAMLANLVETLEPVATGLQHIQLMHGAKWYGVQFGAPYRTPAREDGPRHMPPNFYYDQQDWLAARQAGRRWTWSGLRPHGVWGFSVGSAMNILTALAIFGTVSRHLGVPLKWPGAPGLYDRVYQLTDTALLARAMVWAATSPSAANEAFNITNGDFTRWSHLWPRLAGFFDLEVGAAQRVRLKAMMADKDALWDEITEAHQLRRYTLGELTNWDFADYALANDFDQMSDVNKARDAGFTDRLDTEATVTRQLERLRRDRIIP